MTPDEIQARQLALLEDMDKRLALFERTHNPERMRKMEEAVFSTDPGSPGFALRLDRLERQLGSILAAVKWLGGGGLAALVGTLVLLWRLGQLLQAAS